MSDFQLSDVMDFMGFTKDLQGFDSISGQVLAKGGDSRNSRRHKHRLNSTKKTLIFIEGYDNAN